mmetsp:Transcript_34627/g.78267  ORF Transcript_34627/g.78267 Transcript_34627/m.78267 type:complete len:109 (+) Transcript_34627:434-760(+)
MTRAKCVHAIRPKLLAQNWFEMELDAAAGTYIKEFVHGDLGRTKPSVGDLLTAHANKRAAAKAEGSEGPEGLLPQSHPGRRLLIVRADITQLDVTAVHTTGILAHALA